MKENQLPPVFTPMLASLLDRPFDSPEHFFELKWDGVRTLAFCDKGSTRLFSRTCREVNHQYPEFSNLHRVLRADLAVFDGEIVALDSQARPSFELLQKRINLAAPRDVQRGVETVSLDLVLFDVVFLDGIWLGGMALEERLERLAASLDFGDRVLRSEAIEEHGIAMFEAAKARGLEGIVAKRKSSHYIPGKRTRDWLKIKITKRVDCVIGGWSPGLGGRSGSLGSVLIGLYDKGNLHHIGSVGTGFTESTLTLIGRSLQDLETAESPFAEKVPIKGARWVKPELVCEVEYREATSTKKLRAPSFKGLRPDKHPHECLLSQLDPPN